MLLEDAVSKEEVQEFLDDGDDELHQDIDEKLELAAHEWRRNEDERFGFRNDQISVLENEIYGNQRFAQHVVDESKNSSYSLDQIPLEFIITRLRTLPVNRGRLGPFSLDTGGSADFSFHFSPENHHEFDPIFLPTNWELIPDSYAAPFWGSLGKIKWDEASKFGHNEGTSEGTDDLYIEARESDFIELCKDILTDYVSDEEHFDSELLVKKFIETVSLLHMEEIEEKDLAALDHELLKGFAVQWFTSTSDTQQDIVESLLDAIAAKAGGSNEEPEHVIMELPKEKLAELGITKGVLAEEAPWKLLKLSARQLSKEGASMNHCVGDRGMGYAEAVRKGEIEIWSLRDRTGKPRFTIEVDKNYKGKPTGQHIEQLKGKGNRTPGYASTNTKEAIKFPDEVTLWNYIFKQLGINPKQVFDFAACRVGGQPDAAVAASTRNFDRPYMPTIAMLSRRLDGVTDFVSMTTPKVIRAVALMEEAASILSK